MSKYKIYLYKKQELIARSEAKSRPAAEKEAERFRGLAEGNLVHINRVECAWLHPVVAMWRRTPVKGWKKVTE
jgi:hypothetical protein